MLGTGIKNSNRDLNWLWSSIQKNEQNGENEENEES
jgi:hypothetical protein